MKAKKESEPFKSQTLEKTDQTVDFVFLADSSLVTCLECYKKHYSHQSTREFFYSAECQSIHHNRSEPATYTLIMQCTFEDSEELKEDCVFCYNGPNGIIQDIYPRKEETPHNCTNKASNTESIQNSFFPMLEAFNKNAEILRNTIYPETYLSSYFTGYSILFERHHENLKFDWMIKNSQLTKEDHKQAINCLKYILLAEFPWFYTSFDFLFSINPQQRYFLLDSLRERLFSKAKSASDLKSKLMEIADKSADMNEIVVISLFFPKIERIELIFKLKEGLILSDKYIKLCWTEILEMTPTEWENIKLSLKNIISSFFNNILISIESDYYKQTAGKVENNNEILKTLPIYPLNSKIPPECLKIADRFHFLIKKLVYKDSSVSEILDDLLETVAELKTELEITSSKDYFMIESPLTPDQKAVLLYKSPVISTLLMTAQLVIEEYFLNFSVNRYFPQIESILNEIYLIFNELAQNCYDISIFLLINGKTLLNSYFPSESVQFHFEQLFLGISLTLQNFSLDSKYDRMVADLKIDFCFAELRFADRIVFGMQRQLKIKTSPLKLIDFRRDFIFLISDAFQKLPNSNENDTIIQIFSKLKLSQAFFIDFVIGPLIFEETSFESLLDSNGKPGLLNNFNIFSELISLCESESLFRIFKIKLIKHFLSRDSKIKNRAFSSKLVLEIFNSIFGIGEGEFEPTFEENRLTFNMKTNLRNEKTDLLNLYFCLIQGEISENLESGLIILKESFTLIQELGSELDFYNNSAFLSLYSTAIEQINSSSNVKFESETECFRLESVLNFRVENEFIVFKQKLREDENKNIFDILKLTSHKIILQPKEFRLISKVLTFSDNLQAMRLFKNLVRLIKCNDTLQIQSVSYILLNFVSKEQNVKISFSEVKSKMQILFNYFIYAFIQYNNTNLPHLIEIHQIYFEIVDNLLEFFRMAVDGDNLENSAFLSEEKFDFEFPHTLSDEITLSRTKFKLSFLEILVKLILPFSFEEILDEYTEMQDSKEDLMVKILDLISEIIEGSSEKSIDFVIMSSFGKMIRNLKVSQKSVFMLELKDLMLKTYFEVNSTEKHREIVRLILGKDQIIERIDPIFKIDFVDEILKDEEGNKVERLIETYFSERNTSFEEFDRIFKVFVYLKFELKVDFQAENEDLAVIGEFFESITGRVEIKVKDKLKEILFLKGTNSLLLAEEQAKSFVEKVDRSSTAAKNQDTVNYALHYRDELEFKTRESNQKLNKILENTKIFTMLCLLLSLGAIYLMIHYLDVSDKKMKDSAKNTFTGLIITQIGLSIGIITIWYFTKFNRLYRLALLNRRIKNNIEKGEEERKDRIYSRAVVILSSVEAVSVCIMILTGVLALADESLYWVISLQLLCFVKFSHNLSNIVRAIFIRGKQLWLITLFLVGLMLISALLTFNYMDSLFQTEDGDMLCLTLGHCLASQFDFGLRMGGGMGDNMPVQEWQTKLFWRKFFFSVVHFVLFPVIMLNLVAGVIIDTFADLREQAAELEQDINSICLICGGSKGEIEKEEGSYTIHINEKHKVLDYMLFINYVLEKEERELDFYETYVKSQVEKGETSWFPANEEDIDIKIKNLEENLVNCLRKEVKEELEKKFKEDLEKSKNAILDKISFESEKDEEDKLLRPNKNLKLALTNFGFDSEKLEA